VSRVRENRTHGSMGGGRKPDQSGSHSRTDQAPPAYPTNLVALRAPLHGAHRPHRGSLFNRHKGVNFRPALTPRGEIERYDHDGQGNLSSVTSPKGS
jgi:hypothetical protein